MNERRIEERQRQDEAGFIAVDEHTTLPCIVYDVSASGVRLTLPETALVPETFILHSACIAGIEVCRVVWRGDETIGATFNRASA
ncbi:PilZ domain-containing protein [Methylobacterium sp. E-045]|uniref:PilZ domain-containing protein n=1 Tax=Methylobacterium sp. E-045 TaxID=2836575 RepID=UPI001FB88C8E|nr:PilZ domain-containing protein [Methylobacterium sp. E-045]MCJ2132050.1 PilZ domain-containing protein [Methylobacterium sp. E-045]